MNRLVILLVAIPVAAQTNPPKGSISGTVLDGLSGSPLAAADIYVKPGNKSVTTDDKGHYEIKDLDSATYHLSVYTKSRAHGAKEVHLATGQDLTVDFRIAPKASISGRVVDENGEPKPGITLLLVAREYRLGTLRYVFAESAETDDRGRYTISNIEPGSGYLLEAARRMQRFSPVSDAPADPKLRRKTTIPTWYPDSDSMDAAQVMVLQPGEHREGIDIALKKSVSYCIDGILATDKGPGPLNFSIEEREPSSGQSGDGAFFMSPPYSEAGADGRIRVCDLHPGVYRLTAFDSGDNGPTFFGETEVPVGDKDVHGVKAFGRGRISVSGELVWDGKPPDQSLPDQSSPAKVHIWLQPMTRAPFSGELSSTNNLPPQPVPAQFKLPDLLTDDYSVRVLNIPAGAYLKDIVYGGQSALREPMHVGKTMGSDLRVVLAHDGGVIKVKVADKDSNPVPDCKVVLLPESASTESEVADSMLQGQSDQFGVYTSSSLAPGKYFVLATNASVDRTPESIGKLMRARIHAHETELPAERIHRRDDYANGSELTLRARRHIRRMSHLVEVRRSHRASYRVHVVRPWTTRIPQRNGANPRELGSAVKSFLPERL